MADFTKELDTMKELLTDAYNKGYEAGHREIRQKAYNEGAAHRHKRRENNGTSFEVGDKVRTTTNYDWDGVKVFDSGTVGTIISKHLSDKYGIMIYKVRRENGFSTFLYGAADLELVTSAEDKAPVRVGSIVKIVKEYNDYNPSCHLFDKGTLAVVTGVREDRPERSTDGNYKYVIQTPDNIVFFYDRDGFEVIEKVEEDK